jgi:parallel beta-helix repeat protein
MTANRILAHAVKIALISVIFLAPHAYSFTSYFISSAGSDANDGRSSSTPWKTIGKLNASALASGDVVSFRSGDTFNGQITMNQSGLTINSYGSGAKPVITGGIPLTGWTLYSGSIYVASAGSFVKDLFSNGVQMTVARYPNSGLLTVGSTNGSSTVTSTGIIQGSGFWNGGNIHIRTTDWTYETRPVTSSSGSTVNLSGGPEFAYAAGWGFYLDNVLGALDAAGEWYCDPGTNKVYFYAPGGANPNSLTVTGSVVDYGIVGTQGNATIQNLAFQFQAAAAIHFSGSASNVNILSNDISSQWVHGIDFVGSHASCTINGNTFQNINGRGINSWGPQYFTITNNTFKSIGLIPGYGSSGFTGMTAILAQAGAHNTISRNTIDSVGYAGIRHDGSYNLIENNVISNAMLKLCDGGAIYAWGGTGGTFGTTIRNNIIDNVPGDNTGVANQPSVKQGHGIYFDLGCFNMVMEGNTIIHAGDAGVFIQYSDYGITVRNNMFYECAANYYSASLELIQDNSMGHGGNVFTRNVFFPLNNSQPLFRQQQGAALSALQSMGTVDSNYYCDPYSKSTLFHIVYYGGSWDTYVASLAQWKSTIGQDAHSKDMYTKLTTSDTRRSLFVNKTSSPMSVALSPVTYKDLDGVSVTGSITLQPFTSRLLIKDSTAASSGGGGGTDVVLISPSLNNGGFETAGPGGADVFGTWTEEKSAGTGTIGLDAADARTGNGSLLLATDAGATMLVYQPVLTVGQLYRVDFYAKKITGSPDVVVGGWYNKASCLPTAAYAFYSLTFTAADTYLRIYNDIGSSSVVIDDLTLTAVNSTNPLPVELVSFTGAVANGTTILNWKTATEVNTYGFDIEKKESGSATAVWSKIGFVAGSGTTNAPHNYTFTDPSAAVAAFSYRLKQIDTDGQFTYSKEIQMSVTAVTPKDLPVEFALGQNYPNPFNPSTLIQYSVAAAGPVRLTVYDITGREVATLVNGQMEPGRYSVQWNAKNFASGVYIYRLNAGKFTSVKKLLLQK